MSTLTVVRRTSTSVRPSPIPADRGGFEPANCSQVSYAGKDTDRQEFLGMDELSSAEVALAALVPVLGTITVDMLHLPTPCEGFDVAGLADHLVGTVTMVGDSAGVDVSVTDGRPIDVRVADAAETTIEAWRRRGTDGDVVFAGHVTAARLALGVLSIELVVHGWDFAQALHRPLPITAAHADFVLGLARQIITPDSRRTAGFDEPVPVTTDAAALDRLVAYTGRHPQCECRPASDHRVKNG